LDRAITTTYKLLKVTMFICSFLVAILNAMLLPAAITYVRQITVSYPSTDLAIFKSDCSPIHDLVTLLWKIAIFPQPEVWHWPSDI